VVGYVRTIALDAASITFGWAGALLANPLSKPTGAVTGTKGIFDYSKHADEIIADITRKRCEKH